jgi:hypothetical protein
MREKEVEDRCPQCGSDDKKKLLDKCQSKPFQPIHARQWHSWHDAVSLPQPASLCEPEATPCHKAWLEFLINHPKQGGTDDLEIFLAGWNAAAASLPVERGAPDEREKFEWGEFVVHNMCSLCGQIGIIDTRGIRTPANFECGGLHYCICPNGRALKAQKADKLRWLESQGRAAYRAGAAQKEK